MNTSAVHILHTFGLSKKYTSAKSIRQIKNLAENFFKNENVVVPFRLGKNARKYLKKPIIANLVSYGNNVAASVTSEVKTIVSEYINKYEFYHLFETPNMNVFSEKFSVVGCKICFTAEYYLPDEKNKRNSLQL